MYENITIAVASDHGGFHLKQTLMEHLAEKGAQFTDLGAFDDESCDYPDYAKTAADAVAAGKFTFGILVCGTGIGMSIAANKVDGIRAALCCDTFSARMARMHNDANIICLGERVTGSGLACDIIDAFFAAEFMGGKHLRRVDKIMSLEK